MSFLVRLLEFYRSPCFKVLIGEIYFKKNSELMLIVCGSISAWIDKNILISTGFVGRIDLELTLHELSLFECNEFWGERKEQISAYEKFKILSLTGGIPRYLEII